MEKARFVPEAIGMRIIPVLDVMNGLAVRAVGGRRSEYRPLVSRLCASAEPLKVAHAFRRLGHAELYLADLDAIGGGGTGWAVGFVLRARGLTPPLRPG